MAHIVHYSNDPNYENVFKAPSDQRMALREISLEMGRANLTTSIGPMDGIKMPAAFPITSGRAKYDLSLLPEILNGPASWSVAERVKNWIEEIEPGAHQFFPVEIAFKDGTRVEQNYWILNICTLLDSAIDPESSTCRKAGPNLQLVPNAWYYMDPVGVEKKIAVKKDMVVSRAIWRDARYSDIFVSDGFYEKLRSMEMPVIESLSHVNET